MAPGAAASPGARSRKQLCVATALLVLLGASIAYNVWSSRKERIAPWRPQLSDSVVRWHCLKCGHELEEPAAAGAKTCPKCGVAEMVPMARYMCRSHGTRDVALLYDPNQQLVKVKVGDGPWLPPRDEQGNAATRCPVCGEAMAGVEFGRRSE